MIAPTEEQCMVMGFKRGRCVRLQFWGALRAQRCVKVLRRWGYAVTVLTALPDTPSATPS